MTGGLDRCIRCREPIVHQRYLNGAGPYCLDCHDWLSQSPQEMFWRWLTARVMGEK